MRSSRPLGRSESSAQLVPPLGFNDKPSPADECIAGGLPRTRRRQRIERTLLVVTDDLPFAAGLHALVNQLDFGDERFFAAVARTYASERQSDQCSDSAAERHESPGAVEDVERGVR